MGDVVVLDAVRAERSRRRTEAAARHPCLRWAAAGDGYRFVHRRDEDGQIACGIPGAVIVALPGTESCGDCYPPGASG